MNEVWLQLNGRFYSYADLSSGDKGGSLTGFEAATLAFCRDWIRGVQHFTLSTSGSTGTPKTISFQREQMEASARLTAAALNLQSRYTALLCLDPRYIAGQMMIVRSIVTGMNVVAVEPSAYPLASIPPKTHIDFAAVVPYQLQSILDAPEGKNKLNRLKTVLVGGAAVSAKAVMAVQDMECAIYSTYGMTETISHIALRLLNGPEAKDYFEVLPGISISTDARGCLMIGAPYLGHEKIITNDLVDILGPREFRWRGRWDRVINSGGVKVAPEKIERVSEKALDTLGIKRRFFAAGLSDERLGMKAVLVVEGEPFSETVHRTFMAQLTAGLEQYEIPKEVRYVLKFVETPTQKIDSLATLQQV